MLWSGSAGVLLGLTLLLLILTVISYNNLISKVKQFLYDVDNWENQGGIDSAANESRVEVSRELKERCETSKLDDNTNEDYHRISKS
jgi:hypothetical protein